jgi:A/G-specific adenine glycosylase
VTRGDALVAWYRAEGRDLPWRTTTDPYRILVSEVMLQQTQVARVIPAYGRFLAAFPDVAALAAAPLDAVLAAWSGLGYNTRARRLREAARIVEAGGWPTTAAGLRRLPGVGPYTAAAIASFAFGEQVAVDDTNVRRVLSRWSGQHLAGTALREAAQAAITGDAATWNQAMMDFGATVCRPTPRCDVCPVARWCADPTLYRPPPRQSRFQGSDRQVRGAVLRALGGHGWVDHTDLVTATGHGTDRVEAALETLVADGLVERRARSARVAR